MDVHGELELHGGERAGEAEGPHKATVDKELHALLAPLDGVGRLAGGAVEAQVRHLECPRRRDRHIGLERGYQGPSDVRRLATHVHYCRLLTLRPISLHTPLTTTTVRIRPAYVSTPTSPRKYVLFCDTLRTDHVSCAHNPSSAARVPATNLAHQRTRWSAPGRACCLLRSDKRQRLIRNHSHSGLLR